MKNEPFSKEQNVFVAMNLSMKLGFQACSKSERMSVHSVPNYLSMRLNPSFIPHKLIFIEHISV